MFYQLPLEIQTIEGALQYKIAPLTPSNIHTGLQHFFLFFSSSWQFFTSIFRQIREEILTAQNLYSVSSDCFHGLYFQFMYLKDFLNWIKIVMTEIILTMCLSSLKNIYVKLFFMEDRAHEFYWAHFIFDQPSLARTVRDCHYYQHLIILSSLNCPWLPFISFDNLSTLSQVLRLMHPH